MKKHLRSLVSRVTIFVVTFLSITAGYWFFLPVETARATTDSITVTGSWVAPTGVTSVFVECVGGGSGGVGNNGGAFGQPGGGGGAYSAKNVSVTPGNSYTVTIGAAGAGGLDSPSSGGDSWFNDTGTVLAKGGTANGLSAGSGGLAASGVGDTKFDGGNGGPSGSGTNGGGGGGAGGSSGAGSNGTSGSSGGAGGASGGGFSGSGGNGPSSGVGNAGNAAGGGGSGAYANNGGNGAVGQCNLTYTAGSSSPTQPQPYSYGSVPMGGGMGMQF